MTRSATSDNPSRSAWHARAGELARWGWNRYVVRTDVWGGYTALDLRGQKRRRADGTEYSIGPTVTCPAKNKRGLVKLTLSVVEQHFRATRPEQVIGAHTTSPDNYSKFGTIEVDYHGENSNAPEINLRAALGWYRQLCERGFHPLLWDSNGGGGYHLDALLAEPIPTPRLFWFLRELVSNHTVFGLPARPETFPKQSRLTPKPDRRGAYGNWVRLPGRHHTKEHWARVWGGEWLDGERAVDFLLSLQGDDPGLIPEHDEKSQRIRAYLAKVPHGCEGTGRDDRAFNAAAFLVRDMALPDAEALHWLEEWDAGNSPPKGRERLHEIIANAHRYGRNGYRSSAPLSTAPPPSPAAPANPQKLALDLILEDFRRRFEPRFRRGTALYSDALKREVKPSEACYAADKRVLASLAGALDAPKDKRGEPDMAALPRCYWTWSKSAWAELLNSLPEEEESEEVSASAEDQFRRQISSCLYAQAVFGQVIDKHGATEQQRRTLFQWCELWAKPGPWQQVRSALLWCRRDKDSRVCIALRVELFGQYGPRELTSLSQRKLCQLVERYSVGRGNKACGERVVELSRAFIESLQAAPQLTQQAEG